jgi:hypothetical protein
MIGTFRTTRLAQTLLALALAAGPAVAADNSPPAPKQVMFDRTPVPAAALAKAIKEQTGVDVDVSALDATKLVTPDFSNVPFWTAVEKLAERTGSRIVTTGGRVVLKPGKLHMPSPSHVSGPFRFAVRESNARGDLQAGTSTYDVTLEVCWEPRLNTYRIDSAPKITAATDDTGKSLSVATGGARTFTSGNIAPLSVRPLGLTRDAKKLNLTGSIMVTIADELLTFTFDADKPAAVPKQKGVMVTIAKSGTDGTDWFVDVDLRYPPGGATWESNEYYWARNNEMRLLMPKGDAIKADRVDFGEGSIRYVFKNRAKQVGPGWKLDYRTPGPMREVEVKFDLKDIPLP